MARAGAVAIAVGAIGFVPALPAHAGAPPNTARFVLQEHRQAIGAKASEAWAVNYHSGGINANTPINFQFNETSGAQPGNNLLYVALPRNIAVSQVVIIDETTSGYDQTPKQCQRLGATDPANAVHPTAITVDYLHQKFSIQSPIGFAADDHIQVCFDPSIDIGWPLTPSTDPNGDNVSPGNTITVTEPANGASNAADMWPNSFLNNTLRYPYNLFGADTASNMNFFNPTNGDNVSQAGEGTLPPGRTDKVYNIVLYGTQQSVYSLKAESATGVADPRVTITCPDSCIPGSDNTLLATFTVSCGPLDHFVIVSTNTFDPTFKNEIQGVTAFTATGDCPTTTTTTTTTAAVVIPKLPSAGHPLMPTDYSWLLLLLIPTVGVFGWMTVKPD